jgi:hypothetical protein
MKINNTAYNTISSNTQKNKKKNQQNNNARKITQQVKGKKNGIE